MGGQSIDQSINEKCFVMLLSVASQCVTNVGFFNVLLIRQAQLHPKVPKQANFRGSLQKLQAEIEWCANVLALLLNLFRKLLNELNFSQNGHLFYVSAVSKHQSHLAKRSF